MDIDECAGDHGCSKPFHCENTPGSFECACQSGYRKNAGTCNNIDECAEETDDCSQTCTDVPGDFTCECFKGYAPESSDSKTCADVDECQTDAHNCSGLFECRNKIGGFDCLCKVGYTIEGEECIDIDECKQYSCCTCEHICENTDGSFDCSCNEGFELQPDYTTCAPQSSEFNSVVYNNLTRFIGVCCIPSWGNMGYFEVVSNYVCTGGSSVGMIAGIITVVLVVVVMLVVGAFFFGR